MELEDLLSQRLREKKCISERELAVGEGRNMMNMNIQGNYNIVQP